MIPRSHLWHRKRPHLLIVFLCGDGHSWLNCGDSQVLATWFQPHSSWKSESIIISLVEILPAWGFPLFWLRRYWAFGNNFILVDISSWIQKVRCDCQVFVMDLQVQVIDYNRPNMFLSPGLPLNLGKPSQPSRSQFSNFLDHAVQTCICILPTQIFSFEDVHDLCLGSDIVDRQRRAWLVNTVKVNIGCSNVEWLNRRASCRILAHRVVCEQRGTLSSLQSCFSACCRSLQIYLYKPRGWTLSDYTHHSWPRYTLHVRMSILDLDGIVCLIRHCVSHLGYSREVPSTET